MVHDAGVICMCAFCHSFFLSVIRTIDYKIYRGKEATPNTQNRMHAKRLRFVGCE
jgi:hypothetical protein